MEWKIISEVPPDKETKSKILIIISVSELKIIVGNYWKYFLVFMIGCSEYMDTKLIFSTFCLILKMHMGKAHCTYFPWILFKHR